MFLYEHERSEAGDYLYHQFDTDLRFHPHLHHSFEFIFVEEGTLEVQVSDRVFPLGGGEAALILPDQLHAYRTPAHSASYLCVFSCDYLYDFAAAVRGREAVCPRFTPEDPACISYLSAPGRNRFQTKSVLYDIAGQFLAACPLVPAAPDRYGLLGQVIAYAQEHFREPVTLHTAAAALGYHYNYLSGYLGRNLGMGFSALVNRYRVDLACEQLENTDIPITGIAAGCGFDTVRTFNRQFREIIGVTPTAFRLAGRMRKRTDGAGENLTPPVSPGLMSDI